MKKISILIAILAFVSLCKAQNNDSVLYKKAETLYKAEKYSKAYPIFLQLAQGGNKDAQFVVGHYYYFGLGAQETDLNEAIRWYAKSAEQGQPWAQRFMGDFYYTGEGVEQSYAKAFELYKSSAMNGEDESMIQLGLMYERGLYVPKDLTKAREYFMQAINKTGNSRAMICMGDMYRWEGMVNEGNNLDRAIAWYKRAAEQDSATALYKLADLYDDSYSGDGEMPTIYGEYIRENPNYGFLLDTIQPYADKLWLRAANNGSGVAQAIIGFKCFVEKKHSEAMQWYEKAKKNGAESVFRRPNVYLPLDIAQMLCTYFSKHQESNFYFVNYRTNDIFESTPEGWTIWTFPVEYRYIEHMYHYYIPGDYIIVTVEKNGKYGLVKLSKDGKLLGKTPLIYDSIKGCWGEDEGKACGYLDGEEIVINI